MRKLFSIFNILLIFAIVSCSEQEAPFEEKLELEDVCFSNFSLIVGGQEIDPVVVSDTSMFFVVPHDTDLSNLVAKFVHNADLVQVNETKQISGESVNDYSNFVDGIKYSLFLNDDNKTYVIRVLNTDLPVVFIDLQGGKVEDKVNWKDCNICLYDKEGKVADFASSKIKGRGNATWTSYPQKPYAIKLENKESILGMPKHKRWCLLALWRGAIGNALAFESSRRTSSLEYTPKGEFVEVVINGCYNGFYFLCEQIKIDKNRINIAEIKNSDIEYPNISGGYLLEFDELYDEDYKFTTSYFNLPVNLKYPDDNVPDSQIEYISSYIKNFEEELLKIGTSEESHYDDYIDVESFADYLLVLTFIGNYEAYKPRSVYMYKGRDGVDSPGGTICKLKAGPVWDQELFFHLNSFFWQYNSNAHYLKYLLSDPSFVNVLKDKWAILRSNLLGNDKFCPFTKYVEQMSQDIKHSVQRDMDFWRNDSYKFEDEVNKVYDEFDNVVSFIDNVLNDITSP